MNKEKKVKSETFKEALSKYSFWRSDMHLVHAMEKGSEAEATKKIVYGMLIETRDAYNIHKFFMKQDLLTLKKRIRNGKLEKGRNLNERFRVGFNQALDNCIDYIETIFKDLLSET